MADYVTMTHPKLKDSSQRVLRKAFDAVWEEQGWTLVDEKKAAKDDPKANPNQPT